MNRKQLDAETRKAKLWPAVGVLVNPGDLVARLGSGSACSLQGWPRSGDIRADRRAFAAAFVGVSNTFHDPGKKLPDNLPSRPLDVHVGGSYEFAVAGDKVQAKAMVGLGVVEGKLSDASLEVVENADEAVGEVVAASGGGWKVKLLSR